MTQTFKDKIPKKTSVVFFKFDDDEFSWKRAYHWTYDSFCKRGYFNIKGDCTPYPISEKTEYWECENG